MSILHLNSVFSVMMYYRQIVAAGYALYGSATMIVISHGHGVHGFMLDPSMGEFVLTDPNMRVSTEAH